MNQEFFFLSLPQSISRFIKCCVSKIIHSIEGTHYCNDIIDTEEKTLCLLLLYGQYPGNIVTREMLSGSLVSFCVPA